MALGSVAAAASASWKHLEDGLYQVTCSLDCYQSKIESGSFMMVV